MRSYDHLHNEMTNNEKSILAQTGGSFCIESLPVSVADSDLRVSRPQNKREALRRK